MSSHPLSPALRRIGMVARFRPVHLGQVPVLEALCECAERALIGIGSANRHDLRNPFTAAETATMIRLVLAGRDNFELLELPDLDDGPRWRAMVVESFGALDLFVTDNPYVAELLRDDYRIERPVRLVPVARRVPLDGTTVRRAMALGDGWQEMVPPAVAAFIVDNGLDERFRREFGLETLAREIHHRRDHVLMG